MSLDFLQFIRQEIAAANHKNDFETFELLCCEILRIINQKVSGRKPSISANMFLISAKKLQVKLLAKLAFQNASFCFSSYFDKSASKINWK